LFGVFVCPGGGVVGLLPWVVVEVAVGVWEGVRVLVGGFVGTTVGASVGTTVGVGGAVVGCVVPAVVVGVVAPAVGVEETVPVGDDGVVESGLLGWSVGSERSAGVVVDPIVWTAAGSGVVRGRGWCLPAGSGSGINGVSSRGPPNRLLAVRMTYPTAGTASKAPVRRMTRRRFPVESRNTGRRVEGGLTRARSYATAAVFGRSHPLGTRPCVVRTSYSLSTPLH
jgi:hypothetical protein